MAKATPGWPDNGRPSRRRLDAQHTSQRRLELELTRCPARCVSQRVAAAPEAHRDDGLPFARSVGAGSGRTPPGLGSRAEEGSQARHASGRLASVLQR